MYHHVYNFMYTDSSKNSGVSFGGLLYFSFQQTLQKITVHSMFTVV